MHLASSTIQSPLIITDRRAFFYLFIDVGTPLAYKMLWETLAEEIQYIDARCLRRFLYACERVIQSISTVRRSFCGIALYDRFCGFVKAREKALMRDIQQTQFIHDVFLSLA